MNTKIVLACSAIALAFALFASPLALSESASAAISSGISQSSSIKQSSTCVGAISAGACNNIAGSLQVNTGSVLSLFR